MDEKRKGKYIVIEGPGKAGKSVAIKYLKKMLPEEKFFFVKEPAGPIRSILLDPAFQDMDPFTELCLFTACRCELVRKVIVEKLNSGIHVISDRNYLSSKTHQIEGSLRHDLKHIFNLMTETAVGFCPADMYILIIAEVNELLRRNGNADRKGQVDKFDERDVSFQRRVIDAYHEHFPKGRPHRIIDTTHYPQPDESGKGKTGEEVHQIILSFVDKE